MKVAACTGFEWSAVWPCARRDSAQPVPANPTTVYQADVLVPALTFREPVLRRTMSYSSPMVPVFS